MQFWKTYFSRYGPSDIEPVEVERTTDSCVWINGRKHLRASTYDMYFETWEAAHAYLLDRAQEHYNAANRALISADKLLADVVAFRRP